MSASTDNDSHYGDNGSFRFLDQSETEIKRLNFGLSPPEFGLTNRRGAHHCSLHNVIADVIADISVFLC